MSLTQGVDNHSDCLRTEFDRHGWRLYRSLWAFPIVTTKQHQSNPPYSSVEEYFKLSVSIPFLDLILSDLAS